MFHGSQSNSENEIACTPSHKYLVSTCTPRVNHLTVRLILNVESERDAKVKERAILEVVITAMRVLRNYIHDIV